MAKKPEPFWGPGVAPVVAFFARQSMGSLSVLSLIAVSLAFIVLLVTDEFLAFENDNVRMLISFSWDALSWVGIALWAFLVVGLIIHAMGDAWPGILLLMVACIGIAHCHGNSRSGYSDDECVSTRYTPC